MATHRQKLSRHVRLAKSSEFKAVFAFRKKIHVPGLTVYIQPNQLPYSRLGLAISKRVVKTSVLRNRIKRVIRDGFRRQIKQDVNGMDMVFVSRAGLANMDNKALYSVLTKLCQQLPKSSKKYC